MRRYPGAHALRTVAAWKTGTRACGEGNGRGARPRTQCSPDFGDGRQVPDKAIDQLVDRRRVMVDEVAGEQDDVYPRRIPQLVERGVQHRVEPGLAAVVVVEVAEVRDDNFLAAAAAVATAGQSATPHALELDLDPLHSELMDGELKVEPLA